MGKSALDFDDIQAVENRRREIAVLAGASPRETKYEPSPLKEMIVEYIKERTPKVAEKFDEYQKETTFPGYNFTATLPAYRMSGDVQKELDKQTEELEKQNEEMQKLQEEAAENEYEITDTSTGFPKAKPPEEDEEKDSLGRPKSWLSRKDKTKQQKPKAATPVQKPSAEPSPAGSGDPRSAQQVDKK